MIVVLENTRYRGAEETKNGEAFAKELADLVDDDVFVNGRFRFSSQSSLLLNVGVTKFVKEPAVAGYLIEKEINFLGNAVKQSCKTASLLSLAEAKVADKLHVICKPPRESATQLIIGGGMAYTFFKAQGQ